MSSRVGAIGVPCVTAERGSCVKRYGLLRAFAGSDRLRAVISEPLGEKEQPAHARNLPLDEELVRTPLSRLPKARPKQPRIQLCRTIEPNLVETATALTGSAAGRYDFIEVQCADCALSNDGLSTIARLEPKSTIELDNNGICFGSFPNRHYGSVASSAAMIEWQPIAPPRPRAA